MFVIVGAGVSGLSAARALHLAGEQVLVLEARAHVGGRTHSISQDGVFYDMGAQWVRFKRVIVSLTWNA
jgi:phytoene dehydrogenase-like protein